MPTDKTGLNWKNTGVHQVNRDVHLDSDWKSFGLILLKQAPAENMSLAILSLCGAYGDMRY